MLLALALVCPLAGTTVFSAAGLSAEPKLWPVVDLTSKNVKTVLSDSQTTPVLIETCVTAACGLEEAELKATAQHFAGKIKVVRLDTTKEPKLYASMLIGLALSTGNPFVPLVIAQTNGRWVMHTLYDQHMHPITTVFGLNTSAMIDAFVANQLSPESHEPEAGPHQEVTPKANTI